MFNNISKGTLAIVDALSALKGNEKAQEIIEKIDTAEEDAELKKALKEGLDLMRQTFMSNLADLIEEKLKGFI